GVLGGSHRCSSIKLGRPPSRATANLLRSREAATPPTTGGTAANADRHSPSGQALARRHGGGGPRDAPGTAGSGVNAAGPHRRMAWRKTAKESARTVKLQQRIPIGPAGPAGLWAAA